MYLSIHTECTGKKCQIYVNRRKSMRLNQRIQIGYNIPIKNSEIKLLAKTEV